MDISGGIGGDGSGIYKELGWWVEAAESVKRATGGR